LVFEIYLECGAWCLKLVSLIMPEKYDHDHENEIIPFAETNYRNERRRFGIKTDDRRRHVYLLGKTGMGKTTMLENFVISDINNGHGIAYVDPHGDTAEKLLDFIPPHRINDVIYFNPADVDYPIGFNVLEAVDETHKHLVASGLMGVFKKIWPDVWSARMEHIMNNCILALLEYPGSTLLGINRLLVDTEFRRRVIAKLTDPIVREFWVKEYSAWEAKFRNEAIQPIQNKVGQFLSASIIRNIVAQVKSTFDVRKMMDERKIFIVNLAKGRIGEDNSRLLGGMIITKIQMAVMERVDMPESDRQDFYLYVDEFQNFATQSFANILSEARKYRLNLIVAHQYIEQLDEEYVRPAIFGNVGTIIIFRIGAKDAEFLEQEFMPRFLPEDLVNLTKYEIYLKLMIDGVSSEPFSAIGMAPISQRQGSADKVVRVSRERYTEPRAVIEEKVLRWTGAAALTPEMLAAMPLEAPAAGRQMKKPKTMYDYVCTRCKKAIQLPVKLDPTRPIYCEDCLAIIRGERPDGAAPSSGGAGMSAPPMSAAPAPMRAAPIMERPRFEPRPASAPMSSRPMGSGGGAPSAPRREPEARRESERPRTQNAPRPTGEMIIKKEVTDAKPMSLEVLIKKQEPPKVSPPPPLQKKQEERPKAPPSTSPPERPKPPAPPSGSGTIAPGQTISFD